MKAYLKFPFDPSQNITDVTCSLRLHYLLSYLCICISVSTSIILSWHQRMNTLWQGRTLLCNNPTSWFKKAIFIDAFQLVFWLIFLVIAPIIRLAISPHTVVTIRTNIAAILGMDGRKYIRPPLNVSSVLTERLSTFDSWAPYPRIGFWVNSVVW